MNFDQGPLWLCRLGRLVGLVGVAGCLLLTSCAESLPDPVAGPVAPALRHGPFNEYLDSGVVLLAFPEPSADPDLFQIQLQILSKAAKYGPVMAFVGSYGARAEIVGSCKPLGLCELLIRGSVRIVDGQFVGPWVRDYGPSFVTTKAGRVVVLDANYHDVRADWQLMAEKARIDKERMELVNDRRGQLRRSALARMMRQYSADDYGVDSDSEDAEEARRVAERLELLRIEREVLDNRALTERIEDDRSPFFMAKEVLKDPSFELKKTEIDLDGGNLIRLSDGACVTTGDLIGRNIGASQALEEVLTRTYGCTRVIFLRPLPGTDVIEHVDMFLLPAAKRILIADYNPATSDVLAKHVANADSETRALVLSAAVAMNDNARLLTTLGYTVGRVPAPLPRTSWSGTVYPTVLNALVQVDVSGKRHVIMPSYEDYQEDVQEEARELLQAAFGDATIDTVEAMHAAQEQGAVHCLTLVAPGVQSVYNDDDFAEVQGIVRSLEANSKAPPFVGHWMLVASDRVASDAAVHLYATQNQISIRTGNRSVKSWSVSEKPGAMKSGYRLVADDDSADFAFILFKDPNEAQLTISEKKTRSVKRYELKRVVLSNDTSEE